MKYIVLSKEEAKAIGVDLLKFPFYRPSHRIVNFYNPIGQVIITEFDDWMSLGKEQQHHRNGHRLLGIPTDPVKVSRFLPEGVEVQYDCAAWMTTEVIVIRNDGKYYIVGHRHHQYDMIQEDFTDGMELLGELSINGEFVPGFVPRHGFVIRAQRPKKEKHIDYSFDDEVQRNREYYFQILLVNEDGTIEMPIFAQSVKNLVSILSLDDDTRYKRAFRLRHWDYPRLHMREEIGMTEEQLKDRALSVPSDYHPFRGSSLRLQPQVTRGIVEVLGRDGGVLREIAVIPNLELAYVRTYG